MMRLLVIILLLYLNGAGLLTPNSRPIVLKHELSIIKARYTSGDAFKADIEYFSGISIDSGIYYAQQSLGTFPEISI